MQREPSTIRWPALVLATLIALAVTTGVPVMMQQAAQDAPHVDALARAGAGVAPATEVSIEPQRIEVVAVRAPTAHRWFSLASFRRAG